MRIKRICEEKRGERLYVYECPECSGWHLTRMEQEAK